MADITNSISSRCLDMGEKHYVKVRAIVNGIYEQVKNIKKNEKLLLKNMAKYIYDKTEILPTMKMIVLMRDCFVEKLPEGLLILCATGLGLTTLPELPSTLKVLIVSDNELTSLPTLPKGLKVLVCNGNYLTNLPAIPSSVKMILAYNNCFEPDMVVPSSVRDKLFENRYLPSIHSYLYGTNKEEVDNYVLQNTHINRRNCNCGNYGEKLKSLTDEQKAEFKKFAYYFVEPNTHDARYTCGFCMSSYCDRCEYRYCSRFNFDD
jgi:Leucine-rich repeat (LRR) protein